MNEALSQLAWDALQKANVAESKKLRPDLMTWRRGSAQMALRINEELGNVTIYSVLVSGITPSDELYRYLLKYNSLQRRESLALLENEGILYIVLKYTIGIDWVTQDMLEHHVFAMQEVADKLDTELADKYGGQLTFDDWNKMEQSQVDHLLDDLFG